MYKLAIVFALFAYVIAAKVEQNSYEPFMELPCTSFGGLCVEKDQCPEGLEATKGLCPVQQRRGVECCYGLPKKERRCSRIGHCVPIEQHCPENLVFKYAQDCQTNEKCCVLVK